MTQLSLLRDGRHETPKPHKRQRETARAVYKVLRHQGELRRQQGKETREDMVLRCLAAYWNRCQQSPTALELLGFMVERQEHVMDVNSVRPRLTALCEMGVIRAGDKRICRVSGKRVHTWQIREVGA